MNQKGEPKGSPFLILESPEQTNLLKHQQMRFRPPYLTNAGSPLAVDPEKRIALAGMTVLYGESKVKRRLKFQEGMIAPLEKPQIAQAAGHPREGMRRADCGSYAIRMTYSRKRGPSVLLKSPLGFNRLRLSRSQVVGQVTKSGGKAFDHRERIWTSNPT
ncbi:hypothetical protein SAMN02745216_02075 [Desulfatibacillum alkenivorans DSM 16219]|jgi:hypothetical protein|uniref:Uncharacterized protein n=1 Tax=Desulfatibacillum alkenivorans DSM 16219 TaxID=1121393 RepID=A0A1M6LA09_9BACT|nr:hypothetical protein [Desulfatibacillum alkenivorans]SHJ67993.1 hypothetical protein SAMN02745216_02075 [Desulfatibacillum alkenivorans DSM 16219]